MKRKCLRSFTCLMVFVLSVYSCGKDEMECDPICFTVSDYDAKVNVRNLFCAGSEQYTLGGSTTTITTEREGESHTLNFTNIEYISGRISSFDVVIDGESYSYPADACN